MNANFTFNHGAKVPPLNDTPIIIKAMHALVAPLWIFIYTEHEEYTCLSGKYRELTIYLMNESHVNFSPSNQNNGF